MMQVGGCGSVWGVCPSLLQFGVVVMRSVGSL